MKIIGVIDHLSSGGAQRQLSTLAIELHARGHQFELYYYHDNDFQLPRLIEAGVPYFKPEKKGRLNNFLSLRARIKAVQPDVVVAFLTGPSLLSLAVCQTLRNPPPVITSERNAIAGSHTPLRQRIALQAYRLATRVTVNAHHIEAEIKQLAPALAGRLRTIWNGVDLDYFKVDEAQPSGEAMSLLGLSTLDPAKGHLLLVKGLAVLRDKYQLRANVSWSCRRSEKLHPHEKAHRDHINQRLDALELSDQWTWISEQRDVRPVIDACDALVHPSRREGLPNSLCEALACGRPALAAAVLDHPRLITAGQNGFLFSHDNPESVADAIYRLHQLGDEQRRQLGRQARDFASRELSVSRFGDAYEALFNEVIAERQAR